MTETVPVCRKTYDVFDLKYMAQRAIAGMGITDVPHEYGQNFVSIFENYPCSVVDDVLKMLPSEYDGITKLPPISWVKKYAQTKRASHDALYSSHVSFERPTERDVNDIKSRCRDIAAKFGGVERRVSVNPVIEREERLKAYIRLYPGKVRIDQDGHAFFGEWVPKEESFGLLYMDPVALLEEHRERQLERKCLMRGRR